MNPKTFIFIGNAGSGKGTQARFLQEYLKEKDSGTPILYIETGAGFREAIQSDTYTGKQARIINDTGGLQPSFLAVLMWSKILFEEFKGNEHLIFDGTPRSLSEAGMLDIALSFYKRDKPTVIFLNVSREWATKRLEGRSARTDDMSADRIAHRLSLYETNVLPAINYYCDNSQYSFLDINGEQKPDEVFKKIIENIIF